MNQLSVKIYPSDIPREEKEHRLQEALELLLRSNRRKKCEDKGTAEKIAEIKNASQNGRKPA